MIEFIYLIGLIFTAGIYIPTAMQYLREEDETAVGELFIVMLVALLIFVWPFGLGMYIAYLAEK